MKTTTTAKRTTGVFVALGVLAATLIGLAPAASAAEYGSLKITDKQWYVQNNSQVLHVDEDHDTSNGFYYARAVRRDEPGARDFSWVYQPYGAYCSNKARYVGMNQWTGTYTCLPDYDILEAGIPGYTAARDNCRATTGEDYMEAATVYDANGNWTGWTCDDWPVDPNRNGAAKKASTGVDCAPWEPTGHQNGVPACWYTRYAWEDGGSTGESVTATSTKSFSATVTATQSATVTQTRKVKRMTITRTASRTVRGIHFEAFGKAPVFIQRKAQRTATATATRTYEATVSSPCTMSTLALARECADSQALADARQQAEAVATNRANRVALSRATNRATAAAGESAYRAAKNAPVPQLKKRRAAALAEDRAAMNLLKKIQNRFPGYP